MRENKPCPKCGGYDHELYEDRVNSQALDVRVAAAWNKINGGAR